RRLLCLGHRALLRLRTAVAGSLRDRREAILEVPDRDPARAGQRLARTEEALAECGEQPVEVALVDRACVLPVAGCGRLRRRLRIRVVADRVEHRECAAARLVRLAESLVPMPGV